MDVLSMQIANKVRKRMDTEYSGIYETFAATDGQTTFVTSGTFSTVGHLLKVYVDGVRAIQDTDYAMQDGQTIVFAKPLRKGDIVLATTEVVGIPRFTVNNPAYDDTELREKVAGIVAALDDDGDSSILDTIANIKAQWQGADTDLKNLIADKVEQVVVDAVLLELEQARGDKASLQARLDAIVALIPSEYQDEGVKSDITDLQETLAAATEAISISQTNITGLQTTAGLAGTDIADLKERVEHIVAVLDEDGDGEILDALADLKGQWTEADGGLTDLIANKADKSVLEGIEALLEVLDGEMVEKAEATDLGALDVRVGEVELALVNKLELAEVEALLAGKANVAEVTAVADRVKVLEEAPVPTPVFAPLVDAVTGWEYELKVVGGILAAELILFLERAFIHRTGEGAILIGQTEQLTASAEYQDATDAEANFSFRVSDAAIGEVDASGLFTALSEGEVEVTITAELGGALKEASILLTVVAPEPEPEPDPEPETPEEPVVPEGDKGEGEEPIV